MTGLLTGLLAVGFVACGGDGHFQGPGTPAGGGGQGDSSGQPIARVGDACDTQGAIGQADGGLSFCDGGTVRYALLDDLPPAPAGGYTERPEWYPTLNSIFHQLPTETAAVECTPDSVVFTSPIIPNDALTTTIPHGAMIGDHVTPIDHMYIGLQTLAKDPATLTDADYVPVTAPGDGTIIEVSSLGSPTSHRVVIAHGCNLVSVYMVVNRVTGVLAHYADEVEQKGYLRLNVPVTAGDEFGRQRDNPLDFNVFDGTQWRGGFVSPYSYVMGDAWKPYTSDPLPFFTPELRAPLEASLQRLSEPRWGRIDHDVLGAASGNWFLDGTIGYSGASSDAIANATEMIPGGAVPGKNTYAYGHLSLSPHPVDVTHWMFSTGWWSDPNGDPRQTMIELAGGQPSPDALTAASGPVAYRLVDANRVFPEGSTPPPDGSRATEPVGYTLASGQPQGWALVQVVDDATLHIELITDMNAPAPTAFTAAMRSYHR